MMRLVPYVILTTALAAPLGAQQGLPYDPNPTDVGLGALTGPETIQSRPENRIDPNERPKPKLDKRVVNRIAATVNGRPITANEVTFRLMPIAAQLAALYPRQGVEFHRELAKAKKEIINDLVERELVMSFFESQGYSVRDSLIDQEMNRMIIDDYNGDRDRFLKELTGSGMTIRGYRDSTRKKLIVMMMRSMRYDHEIPPTPEEINREYNKTKLMYRDLTKDRITYKKIFIPAVGDNPTHTPEVQLELSELIAKEIREKRETFEDMAKRYSRDTHAQEGGQWPEIERSQLSAEFAAIVFNAREGEVVGPLIDPNGLTIVEVQNKKLASPPPLSEIRERIDAEVRAKRSSERHREWVNRLRAKALIKVYI